ncbi:helix-turn-helix transcriptional regulator [bacterium]|nr:helix-turn-helix transcriptional regulator [bacterium]
MNEIKYLLGLKIKELRNKKGLSQQQLAELINIDQRNLSNIECGNTFPTKSLLAITEAFNITLPELFDFNYLAKNTDDMKKYIVKRLDNLDNNNIKILYKLIHSMQ